MSLDLKNPLIEIGDASGQFEAWRISGFDDDNTDRGTIYVSAAPSGSDVQVSLFSDQPRTVLVAQGTGATGSRITLAEQGTSGLSGSVLARNNAVATIVEIIIMLASEEDIVERDEGVRSFLLCDPPEVDFGVIVKAVMRDFLLELHSIYPPSTNRSNDLQAFDSGVPVETGRRGRTNLAATFMWRINNEGNFEVVGLQNPMDYKEWAITKSLALIWQRRERGQDTIFERVEILEQRAFRQFRKVIPWVDTDSDRGPDRPARTTSLRFRRM